MARNDTSNLTKTLIAPPGHRDKKRQCLELDGLAEIAGLQEPRKLKRQKATNLRRKCDWNERRGLTWP